MVSQFLDEGWHVVAASRQRTEWPTNASLDPVVMDVADAKSVAACIDEAAARHGRIDCLVHNAGASMDGLSWQFSDEDWDRLIEVNLKGAFYCARAASRHMMKQRAGHMLFISSFAGRAGARGQAAYASAKAGLFGLAQSLARELGPRNVRANAILPGVLPTKMTAGLSEEQLRSFAQANALGRINDLDEVARFVCFLASTRNISGQLFQLDSRMGPWS